MDQPKLPRPLGIVVAVLIVAVVIAGIVGVPYRSTRPPEGGEQPRVHWGF